MLPAIRTGDGSSTLATTPIDRFSTFIDRFFENAFAPFASLAAAMQQWDAAPISMSVWEDDDAVHVELDAPGVAEKDVEITVHDGDLIVRYERKVEQKRNGYDTRSYGKFTRRISLPAAVDVDRTEAKLTGGVLKVRCPKAESAKPKKIEVKAE